MARLKLTPLERGQLDAYLDMALDALIEAERVTDSAALGQDFPFHGHPLPKLLRERWVDVHKIKRDAEDPEHNWTTKSQQDV